MNTPRITPVLDALGAIKNLTIEELLPVLQALDEKTMSSQDYGTQDERVFFRGMFDDAIGDTRYYIGQRNGRMEAEEADRRHDLENGNCAARLFAHYGDRSNASERVAA